MRRPILETRSLTQSLPSMTEPTADFLQAGFQAHKGRIFDTLKLDFGWRIILTQSRSPAQLPQYVAWFTMISDTHTHFSCRSPKITKADPHKTCNMPAPPPIHRKVRFMVCLRERGRKKSYKSQAGTFRRGRKLLSLDLGIVGNQIQSGGGE